MQYTQHNKHLWLAIIESINYQQCLWTEQYETDMLIKWGFMSWD